MDTSFRAARSSAVVSLFVWASACLASVMFGDAAHANTLDPAVMTHVQSATFEVVMAKPIKDTLTYEKPLPLDLLPYQQRNDKFYSIGTAFALGHNRYVTASHVIAAGLHSLWGAPELRDSKGHVYAIDKVEKYSSDRDYVVFSLVDDPAPTPLEVNTHPVVNQPVYAVGNALGEGVVTRDGLYTSDTPEELDGRWKWIRFSAATSPGNSGGPLLDQNGKVIGVVLAKSPNENLNFALPIAEVLDAPDHVAVLHARETYSLPFMTTQLHGIVDTTFPLPLSMADFTAKMERVRDDRIESQRSALLKQEAGELFPNGEGAQRILHAAAPLNTLPELLVRSADGKWHGAMQKGPSFPLADDAQVVVGHEGPIIVFHVRRPSHVPAAQYYDRPKLLMDTLLATGFDTRAVGTEKVKITSLGEPIQTVRHVDKWGRPWRVDVWPVAFANMYVETIALPVPDGYVVGWTFVSAPIMQSRIADLQAVTDFLSVAYDGKLSQWQEFLQNSALLPASLKDLKLDVNYDHSFSYTSDRIKLTFTSSVQKITPSSTLRLGFGFFKNHDAYTLDVADVRVKPQSDIPDRINIRRILQPSNDMDETSKTQWQKYATAQHPYDGVSYVENDVAEIAKEIKPAHEQPDVRYTAFLGIEGNQLPDQMKSKLDQLASGVQIRE